MPTPEQKRALAKLRQGPRKKGSNERKPLTPEQKAKIKEFNDKYFKRNEPKDPNKSYRFGEAPSQRKRLSKTATKEKPASKKGKMPSDGITPPKKKVAKKKKVSTGPGKTGTRPTEAQIKSPAKKKKVSTGPGKTGTRPTEAEMKAGKRKTTGAKKKTVAERRAEGTTNTRYIMKDPPLSKLLRLGKT